MGSLLYLTTTSKSYYFQFFLYSFFNIKSTSFQPFLFNPHTVLYTVIAYKPHFSTHSNNYFYLNFYQLSIKYFSFSISIFLFCYIILYPILFRKIWKSYYISLSQNISNDKYILRYKKSYSTFFIWIGIIIQNRQY